jgi:TolB protein
MHRDPGVRTSTVVATRWTILAATVLAACGPGAVAPTVGRASPTGGSLVPTVAPATAMATPTSTARSQALPARGRILFIVEDQGGNRIEILDASGQREIATTDPTLAKASWAPGDTILFDSERAVLRHVFRMAADGTSVVQLTSGPAFQERPAMSSDGKTIAYAEFEAAFVLSHGLFAADADGSHPRQLTPNGKRDVDSADTSPAFSPDGKWVAFERVTGLVPGQAGLFLVHPDGSGLRRLTDDSLGAGYPRWSPDGKRILFTQNADGTTFLPGPLWVVDIAGGAPVALTNPVDPGISMEGDWSPDGSQIVYVYFAPGMDHNELRVVDADGTHMTTLWAPAPGEGGGAETPDWGR